MSTDDPQFEKPAIWHLTKHLESFVLPDENISLKLIFDNLRNVLITLSVLAGASILISGEQGTGTQICGVSIPKEFSWRAVLLLTPGLLLSWAVSLQFLMLVKRVIDDLLDRSVEIVNRARRPIGTFIVWLLLGIPLLLAWAGSGIVATAGAAAALCTFSAAKAPVTLGSERH